MRHHQLLLGPCTPPRTPPLRAQPPLFIIFSLFLGYDYTSSKTECVPLEFYRMPSPLHVNVSTYISFLLLLQLYWSLSPCNEWTSTNRLRCNLSPYLDVWLWRSPTVFYRFASTLEFAKYLAKVSRQIWAAVSFAYGSFRIRKPGCSGETTCPATSDTAHSVHKTSRGGKSPLFFLTGDNSYKKKQNTEQVLSDLCSPTKQNACCTLGDEEVEAGHDLSWNANRKSLPAVRSVFSSQLSKTRQLCLISGRRKTSVFYVTQKMHQSHWGTHRNVCFSIVLFEVPIPKR